jgi:Sulfotransferase family
MKLWTDMTGPARQTTNSEELMRRATALFRAVESEDLQGIVAAKIEELQYYDVLGMDRAVSIMSWGRSGSLLLSSYLDGHDDVLTLPELSGERLYEFFERYQCLPWRDKLIAYAAFEPDYPRFFEGDFAISPDQYYAAAQAIAEFYSKLPPAFLESRRAFFLFVHIAYNLALGRRPSTSRPLIAFALHALDDAVARYVVEDFPRAQFVHTVRDPISSCNGMFRFLFAALNDNFPRTYVLAPYSAICCLTNTDRPHCGMESRTRTVRLEDLHRDPAETMRALADWLGLPHQATLLDSTFNGIPYIVTSDGKAWSGRRVEQIQRKSWDLSRKDRALLFALFYENFVEWDYPCPKMFGHPTVRFFVFVSLLLVPLKMESIAARAIFERRILPSLRHGNISHVFRCLFGIGFCRLKMIWLLGPAFFRRFVFGAALLQVEHKQRPLERCEDAAVGARIET